MKAGTEGNGGQAGEGIHGSGASAGRDWGACAALWAPAEAVSGCRAFPGLRLGPGPMRAAQGECRPAGR